MVRRLCVLGHILQHRGPWFNGQDFRSSLLFSAQHIANATAIEPSFARSTDLLLVFSMNVPTGCLNSPLRREGGRQACSGPGVVGRAWLVESDAHNQ